MHYPHDLSDNRSDGGLKLLLLARFLKAEAARTRVAGVVPHVFHLRRQALSIAVQKCPRN